MPRKSPRPTPEDIRAFLRVVNECRDLGNEVAARHARLPDVLLILDGGVCRLFTEYSSGPRAVLEWLQEELGRPLATTADPAARLTPRQRQVLECLLDGDSEKQAAARLGLHPGTLHVHVKRVYKALGVSSRAELLAHFLRRYRAASRPTPGADGNPRA